MGKSPGKEELGTPVNGRDALLRIFIEHTPAPVAMFDTQMRYLAYSRRWLDDYQLGDRDITGLCHYDVFPELPEKWKEVHRRCLSGISEKCNQEEFVRADGRSDWVRWEIHPWRDASGEIGGIIIFSEVITDRILAARELEKYRNELEDLVRQRTAELEFRTRELEAFCYSVSHDLRAPLRSIGGFSQLLLDDNSAGLDVDSKQHLNRIIQANRRMEDIIDNLLRLSRITRQEMKQETVDLSQLALNSVARQKETAPRHRVAIDIAPGLKVTGDAQLLKIAIDNLISNAWKYTGKREDAHIEVGWIEQGGQAVYFVRDNGAGFDMQYYEKLFKPFQRLHGDAEFEGMGVGLCIVDRIIHRHRGRLWAQSAVDKGCAVYFTLGDAGD